MRMTRSQSQHLLLLVCATGNTAPRDTAQREPTVPELVSSLPCWQTHCRQYPATAAGSNLLLSIRWPLLVDPCGTMQLHWGLDVFARWDKDRVQHRIRDDVHSHAVQSQGLPGYVCSHIPVCSFNFETSKGVKAQFLCARLPCLFAISGRVVVTEEELNASSLCAGEVFVLDASESDVGQFNAPLHPGSTA